MKDDALEVAAARVPDEVLDGLGRLLREETEVHVSERRVDRRRVRERRRPAPDRGRRGRDRLLLARRSLVEDVTVT